ncbi:hypothetical protein [Kitasatospora cineracea]|uniref:hypothetical protein n=1 Tax=Kitasatospora cineracea TaxID=88074 RepID=UPI0037A2A36B
MSGRGRGASLPPGGGPSAPEPLDEGGLVVRHRNVQGLVRAYDFSTLPVAERMQRSLARAFAIPCRRSWTSHRTSQAYWRHLMAFAQHLEGLGMRVEDLDELDAQAVRRWWETLRWSAGGRTTWQGASLVLRHDERLLHGPVAEELARRVVVRPTVRKSYTGEEFGRIRTAARRTFRSALLRIEDNARHLGRWRCGELAVGSAEWTLGEALDVLARTGYMPTVEHPCGKRSLPHRYRRVLGGTSSLATWKRLFLSRLEAAALGVLLVADFGWNLSVIERAPAPRAAPDGGEPDGQATYLLPVEKRRRGGGRWFETESVTDVGAGSAGRLVTEALAATRFARDLAERLAPGTDYLVAWRVQTPSRTQGADLDRPQGVGPIRFAVDTASGMQWARAAGFGGSPFLRGRRTVLAVERREPAQHSQRTHDRQYALPDEQVQQAAVPVIAAGARSALAQARRAVGLEAELSGEIGPGDRPTATADCSTTSGSPVPTADGGCGASFLLCLGCRNARIHPGHHPRLAHLHQCLDSIRAVVPAAVWEQGWADAHGRLEDLRRRLGDAVWQHALTAVSAIDQDLVRQLLAGDLDP